MSTSSHMWSCPGGPQKKWLSLQSGKFDEATKQLDAALAQAPALAANLRRTLLSLKAHFAAVSGKAAKADAKDSAAVVTAAAAQTVLSGKLTGDAAKSAIADAVKRVESSNASSVAPEAAKLAWAACVAGLDAQAESLCAAAASSGDEGARCWVQLTRAQLRMASESGTDSLTVPSVAARRQALEAFETCIRDFQRAKDVEGVHAACRCVCQRCCTHL